MITLRSQSAKAKGMMTELKDYQRRFLKLVGVAPPGLGLMGVILFLLGEHDIAYVSWTFALIQLLILACYYLWPNRVRLFAQITLYFYSVFALAGVLFFGGILTSGGLVFVGLAAPLLSLSFLRPVHFRILFIMFVASIIVEAIAQPFLPEMGTMGATTNLVLFVLHILVIANNMFTQISEYLKQSLKAKENEARRLKEMDAIKSRFYAGITHEFRTPLTVILGMAEQIIKSSGKCASSGARMIRDSGSRLLQLVNQMLDLARLQSKKMDVHLVQGDILPLIEYIIEPLARIAEEQDVHVHYSCRSEHLVMDYDSKKLESILFNLVSNAIKHSDPGSEIDIQAESVRGEQADYSDHFSLFEEFGIGSDKSYFQLSVSDHGPGIRAEDQHLIFEQFHQLENNQAGHGSGIGLALVKELLAILHGNLYLKSQPGIGSTFIVVLPVSNHAPMYDTDPNIDLVVPKSLPRDGIPETGAPARVSGKEHVLVIEDNPGVLAYLRTILEGTYHVTAAANGRAGIEQALETVPDIIITDIMMPEADGYEVCDKLKSDMRASHIPIIMLTAKADTRSKIEGLQTGADDYIVKPFQSEELLARINSLLSNRKKLKLRYTLDKKMSDQVNPENPDDIFMARLYQALENSIGDETLDTNLLSRELHMSRTQLFRKLKALTGHSASQLIKHARVTRAKQHLRKSDMSITQIAFEVGFKDSSYFSKVFFQETGMTPSDFRASERVSS